MSINQREIDATPDELWQVLADGPRLAQRREHA